MFKSNSLKQVPAKPGQIDKAARRAVTCFTPATSFVTLHGKRPASDLRAGDKILTRDNGFQPVLWIGTRQINFHDSVSDRDRRPIVISAGALGAGQPDRDLVVSPGHRLLTADARHLKNLQTGEALIEARALVGMPGIRYLTDQSVTYIHLLFEQHEVILSDNAWSESFHMSLPAAQTFRSARAKDIISAFPDLTIAPEYVVQKPARPLISLDKPAQPSIN